MMTTRTYFNVHFTDSWLGIDDFRMIEADSADEANNIFNDEHYDEERHEVVEVERAFELDMRTVERAVGADSVSEPQATSHSEE